MGDFNCKDERTERREHFGFDDRHEDFGCECEEHRDCRREHREPECLKDIREGIRDIRLGVKEIEKDFCCREGRKHIREGLRDVEKGKKKALRELEERRCDLSCEGIREIRKGIHELQAGERDCADGLCDIETCCGKEEGLRELHRGIHELEKGLKDIEKGFKHSRCGW